MKKIGIIGGLSPESTISYYDGIIDAFRKNYRLSGYPEIVIESLNLKLFSDLARDNEWKRITTGIAERCENLRMAGAEFGAIASNTPHKVFKQIQENTALPLISIVEATKEFAIESQYKKLILLGTQFTMSSTFFQDSFRKDSIELITPDKEQQHFIHEKIFTEMVVGSFLPDTKKDILDIVEKIKSTYDCEGVILACTELPLLISKEDLNIARIDPASIHINSIVRRSLIQD